MRLRDVITPGVCIVGIVVVVAFIEPRAFDWLKFQLAEVVSAPASAAQAVVSVVGDIWIATARRLSLWRAPIAMFALAVGVLVFLLRNLK